MWVYLTVYVYLYLYNFIINRIKYIIEDCKNSFLKNNLIILVIQLAPFQFFVVYFLVLHTQLEKCIIRIIR